MLSVSLTLGSVTIPDGLFTDPFEKDTDLEGGSQRAVILDLSPVLKRAIALDLGVPADDLIQLRGVQQLAKAEKLVKRRAGKKKADLKFPLYRAEELLQLVQMLALMEDAADSTYQSNPIQLRQDVAALCKNYRSTSPITSRIIVIPGGWTTPSGGHAIMYIIEATSKRTISWTTSNTGQGVGAHPSSGSANETIGDHGGANRTGAFGSITSARVDDIDVARVDDLWCCALMWQQNTTSDNNDA